MALICFYVFFTTFLEYGRLRRLRKIAQGIDPNDTTPSEYQTDLNDSFHEQFHKNYSKKKEALRMLREGNRARNRPETQESPPPSKAPSSKAEPSKKSSPKSSEQEFEELEDTMLCPEDQAEKIAVDMIIDRYLREGGDHMKLDPLHIWQYVLRMIRMEDYTKAFEILFRFDDDIYFLRACLICGGVILPKVHRRTAIKILKKLSQIKVGGRVEKSYLGFIEKGIKANLLDLSNYETSLLTLEALEVIAGQFSHNLRARALYLHEVAKEIIRFNN